MTIRQLRKRFCGLDIIEKPRVKDDFSFLRWQAHDIQVENIVLPRIPRVRDEVNTTQPIRTLVAFGSTLEELEQHLAERYFRPMEEAA